VPDFTGSYSASDRWITEAAPATVLSTLATALGAIADQGSIEASLGSPLAMRVWGFLTPTKKVPIRVKITATDTGAGTEINAHAISNQNWYAVSVSPLAQRIYNRGFQALFAKLRRAAPPA